MEPGHEDREYADLREAGAVRTVPQWSPVMKTGNTRHWSIDGVHCDQPQWSPVMKTGNTRLAKEIEPGVEIASMEPGHEDREYIMSTQIITAQSVPQWSPVMKTGNTRRSDAEIVQKTHASMEPGHEDREYGRQTRTGRTPCGASMEPGHEDREYLELSRISPDTQSASMEPGHEDREYRGVTPILEARLLPQWSPVMKTGNTSRCRGRTRRGRRSLNGARS